MFSKPKQCRNGRYHRGSKSIKAMGKKTYLWAQTGRQIPNASTFNKIYLHSFSLSLLNKYVLDRYWKYIYVFIYSFFPTGHNRSRSNIFNGIYSVYLKTILNTVYFSSCHVTGKSPCFFPHLFLHSPAKTSFIEFL